MKCPVCKGELVDVTYSGGRAVGYCPKCFGDFCCPAVGTSGTRPALMRDLNLLECWTQQDRALEVAA